MYAKASFVCALYIILYNSLISFYCQFVYLHVSESLNMVLVKTRTMELVIHRLLAITFFF